MKIRNLLTLTLGLTMLFFATGAFSQTTTTEDPFTGGTDFDMHAITGSTVDSVTVGQEVPFFVEPDDVINDFTGTYDTTATNAAQGIYTSFNWTFTPNDATGAGIEFPAASLDTAAFVLINAGNTPTGSAGTPSALDVFEYNPGVSCSGNTQTVDIRVMDAPSFDVTDDDTNDTLEVCAGTSQSITLNSIAENNIEKYGNLLFHVDTSVWEVNASDFSRKGSAIDTAEYYATKSESIVGTSNHDFYTRNFQVQDGDGDGNAGVTMYTYIFRGMNDHISRKSDFYDIATNTSLDVTNTSASDYTYYGPSGNDDRIVVMVFPSPSTGDVYHVPNNFDLQ